MTGTGKSNTSVVLILNINRDSLINSELLITEFTDKLSGYRFAVLILIAIYS